MRNILTVLFSDFETLDVFGPIEIFGRFPDRFHPEFYSLHGGAITSSHNVQVITGSFSDISSGRYVLFVPGGTGVRELVKEKEFIGALTQLGEKAEFIITVCTGSILFSKTGLLDGRRATSNKRVFAWTCKESPDVHWTKKARWVKDGNIYTSSGVSAGMDMALGFVSDLLGREAAKQASVEIEYAWHENSEEDPFAELYP
jgi:transcriptional regulator GlxA family with amidase domain